MKEAWLVRGYWDEEDGEIPWNIVFEEPYRGYGEVIHIAYDVLDSGQPEKR